MVCDHDQLIHDTYPLDYGQEEMLCTNHFDLDELRDISCETMMELTSRWL
ncbi:unnamed protein product [uncultured virus]|nr:unnamed protein product [uncultured virus]